MGNGAVQNAAVKVTVASGLGCMKLKSMCPVCLTFCIQEIIIELHEAVRI